jgi:Tfp pilus assembly protein PilN
MRAVNLIPTEDRRGAGGAAGRSGGGVYVLLGALALLVVMAGAYVLTGKSLDDKKSELTRVTHEAEQAEARSNALANYTRFASIRTKRVQTVSQLAASRFDWSHALHEVARVLPTNAWLTQLAGTTSPTVNIGGGNPLRGALPVPALEIHGCTTSQASVARMMARMRLIDGVQRVSLSASDKGAKQVRQSGTTSSAPATSGGDDCRGGSNHFPQFTIIVFFEPSATPAPSATGGTTQTAALTGAASSATPASSSTPAASTPSSPASGGATP